MGEPNQTAQEQGNFGEDTADKSSPDYGTDRNYPIERSDDD